MKPTLKLTVSLRTFTPDLNDPSNLGSMGDISTEVAKFFFPHGLGADVERTRN